GRNTTPSPLVSAKGRSPLSGTINHFPVRRHLARVIVIEEGHYTVNKARRAMPRDSLWKHSAVGTKIGANKNGIGCDRERMNIGHEGRPGRSSKEIELHVGGIKRGDLQRIIL